MHKTGSAVRGWSLRRSLAAVLGANVTEADEDTEGEQAGHGAEESHGGGVTIGGGGRGCDRGGRVQERAGGRVAECVFSAGSAGSVFTHDGDALFRVAQYMGSI